MRASPARKLLLNSPLKVFKADTELKTAIMDHGFSIPSSKKFEASCYERAFNKRNARPVAVAPKTLLNCLTVFFVVVVVFFFFFVLFSILG